uniref:GDNF domain-containing protein n=1 Tax=Heterorhabditis bacteriophora TaxID=37862 RepID=A0A1I7WF45_HETBA
MRRIFAYLLSLAICFAYNSCLHQRSLCLRDLDCKILLDRFEDICGYSLTICSVTSPSECVHNLWRIREYFPYKTCICYEALGMKKEKSHKRTTRTPLSDQIQKLKSQLNGELETREVLKKATCDAALNNICLRHVSCRQLWKLFRSSCDVDQDNQCRMNDRETCWQSFEGLSWTGLGSCHCDSNNSDCHWIRLHTNYNKCIYEISKAGQYPVMSGSIHNRNGTTPIYNQFLHYQQRYETGVTGVISATVIPSSAVITTRIIPTNSFRYTTFSPEPKSTTSTTMPTIPTTSRFVQRPKEYDRNQNYSRLVIHATTVPSWWQTTAMTTPSRYFNYQRHNRRTEQIGVAGAGSQLHYRPLFQHGELVGPTPLYYYHYPTVSPTRGMASQASITPTTLQSVWSGASRDQSLKMVGKPILRPTLGVISSPSSTEFLKPTVEQQSFRIKAHVGTNSEKTLSTGNNVAIEAYPQGFVSRQHPAPYNLGTDLMHYQNREIIVVYSTSLGSSCQDSISRCEATDECRWHLEELRIRCSKAACRRNDCAAALQRFSRFVPFSLVEAIMFCHCSAGDTQCSEQQGILYPKCLYSLNVSALTCTETARKCDADPRCRASLLEQPCFCPLSDVECLSHQKLMIPNNPCIEMAMMEYSERMGYNVVDNKISSIETNRVSYWTPTIELGQDNQQTGEWNTKDEDTIYSADTRINMKSEGSVQRGSTSETTSGTLEIKTVIQMPITDEKSQSQMQIKYQSTTSTTTPPSKTKKNEQLATRAPLERKPSKKYRTTVKTPVTTTELPPPWVSTTPELSTTTTTFMTHAPPPPEGCNAKDANGRHIFINIGTLMRRYVDWSGRCSSWCECVAENELVCERLPCLEDVNCETPLTTIDFGERLYLKDRGACFCEAGNFICDLPEEMPETYSGLYLSAGYSTPDVEMLRREIPRDALERAGFLSADAATDIASRLQIAFERLLPKWHSGWAEKVCSPHVARLANHFTLSESPRFQLVLSTVKQLKVMDSLNGLPSFSFTTFRYLVLVMFIVPSLM